MRSRRDLANEWLPGAPRRCPADKVHGMRRVVADVLVARARRRAARGRDGHAVRSHSSRTSAGLRRCARSLPGALAPSRLLRRRFARGSLNPIRSPSQPTPGRRGGSTGERVDFKCPHGQSTAVQGGECKNLGRDGSKIAVVFNGSPLFSGDARSGESSIRRWIIEHDMQDALVSLPDRRFHHTGVSTCIWIVTDKKPVHHRGKVLLVDVTRHHKKMDESLGDKRNELADSHIQDSAPVRRVRARRAERSDRHPR